MFCVRDIFLFIFFLKSVFNFVKICCELFCIIFLVGWVMWIMCCRRNLFTRGMIVAGWLAWCNNFSKWENEFEKKNWKHNPIVLLSSRTQGLCLLSLSLSADNSSLVQTRRHAWRQRGLSFFRIFSAFLFIFFFCHVLPSLFCVFVR